MPDARTHRGPDPRDRTLFDPSRWPGLREAVRELSWLLSRGYAEVSALKLVGDRHALTDRQRIAVRRSSCPDASLASRRARREVLSRMRVRALRIDGFNVLTTVEAALGGAVLLKGRDGAFRDLAGVHGTYRRVEETRPAIGHLGETLAELGISPCLWYLDSPVSNSGRLAGILREVAEGRGWDWSVELVFDPDAILREATEAVATADGAILDRCRSWVALARLAVERHVPGAFVVDLAIDGDP